MVLLLIEKIIFKNIKTVDPDSSNKVQIEIESMHFDKSLLRNFFEKGCKYYNANR